ncbi:UPF0176 protein YceA [Candidatus Erwinia haradaeae]|uniref:tRNA uridine(34) hydroxylase n=2 Tax=Candidatus Erwinia haradaeae TaxID=1922217 RepID=A0A451D1S5_9GAMM|nr:UPF0176 protein YceA [Candidatus Erwinia haradaeae]
MSVLYNIISNKKLKTALVEKSEDRLTISFYKYFTLHDPFSFRDALYLELKKLRVFGRIYIAKEGINAQLSVPCILYKKMKAMIYTFHSSFSNLEMNIALDNNRQSFWVLRVKVREKILADGITETSFNANDVGVYIDANTTNNFQNHVRTVFVDMRNDYEYAIGHFHKALAVPGNTFRYQLLKIVETLREYKNYNIVLYCTGGIRCEKASAWIRHHGYKNVYQVKGGIINYVHQARTKGLPIYFIGKNFVFDQRMYEVVSKDVIGRCYQCGKLHDNYINCCNDRCHKLFIQCDLCAEKFHSFCSIACMRI